MDYSKMTQEELNEEFRRTRPSAQFDRGTSLIMEIFKLVAIGCILVLGVKIFLALM